MSQNLSIYLALCCINHDHINYGPGQAGGLELALTHEQAEPLLAVGAIKAKADPADTVDAAPQEADAPASAKPAAKKK